MGALYEHFIGYMGRKLIFTHRKRGNILVMHENLIDCDLQPQQTTFHVIIQWQIVHLIEVVPQDTIRAQIGCISIPYRVLQTLATCLVEHDCVQVPVAVPSDRLVKCLQCTEALDP